MPYAAKAKAQQFTRRKSNLTKTVDQLARFCHADVALIIRRNGRYYTYRSTDHEQWPLSMTEIVRMNPMYRHLSSLELRKPLVPVACQDFDYTIREVSHNSKVVTLSNERVQSRLRKAHECYLMSHSMYLAVWVMLYGSDVEEAEIIMPILALLTGASPE